MVLVLQELATNALALVIRFMPVVRTVYDAWNRTSIKEEWSKEARLRDLRPSQLDPVWMVHLQRDLDFGIIHELENAL
jgi:hypothetical protein